MSHSTSSPSPQVTDREKYAETVQFKILDWYITIGRSFVSVGDAVDSLRLYSGMDMQTLGQAIAEINSLRRSIQLFASTLFTREDMKKVRDYEECLKESLARPGRKTISKDVEQRKRGYLEGRLWAEDQYQALLLQHDSLRNIVAANRWFELSGRPESKGGSLHLG